MLGPFFSLYAFDGVPSTNGAAERAPLACQEWMSTKVACRFFDNDRVPEEDILAGHLPSTAECFGGVSGTMLAGGPACPQTGARARSTVGA